MRSPFSTPVRAHRTHGGAGVGEVRLGCQTSTVDMTIEPESVALRIVTWHFTVLAQSARRHAGSGAQNALRSGRLPATCLGCRQEDDRQVKRFCHHEKCAGPCPRRRRRMEPASTMGWLATPATRNGTEMGDRAYDRPAVSRLDLEPVRPVEDHVQTERTVIDAAVVERDDRRSTPASAAAVSLRRRPAARVMTMPGKGSTTGSDESSRTARRPRRRKDHPLANARLVRRGPLRDLFSVDSFSRTEPGRLRCACSLICEVATSATTAPCADGPHGRDGRHRQSIAPVRVCRPGSAHSARHPDEPRTFEQHHQRESFPDASSALR